MFSDYKNYSKEELLDYIGVLESIVIRVKLRKIPILKSIIANRPIPLDLKQKTEILRVLRKAQIDTNES